MPLSNIKPARVLINAGGEAVPPEKAKELGVTVEGIFIRNDGWSLGFPLWLEMVAYHLWADEWMVRILSDGKIAKV